jgi:serine/threonine protein kinase
MNEKDTYSNISKLDLQANDVYRERVSPLAKDFISRILVTDPKLRMSLSEMLRHEWLVGNLQSSSMLSERVTGVSQAGATANNQLMYESV